MTVVFVKQKKGKNLGMLGHFI